MSNPKTAKLTGTLLPSATAATCMQTSTTPLSYLKLQHATVDIQAVKFTVNLLLLIEKKP